MAPRARSHSHLWCVVKLQFQCHAQCVALNLERWRFQQEQSTTLSHFSSNHGLHFSQVASGVVACHPASCCSSSSTTITSITTTTTTTPSWSSIRWRTRGTKSSPWMIVKRSCTVRAPRAPSPSQTGQGRLTEWCPYCEQVRTLYMLS